MLLGDAPVTTFPGPSDSSSLRLAEVGCHRFQKMQALSDSLRMSKDNKSHSKKISVDLRGFHIFDDGEESSDDENEDIAKKKAQKKALKDRIKHAQVKFEFFVVFFASRNENRLHSKRRLSIL